MMGRRAWRILAAGVLAWTAPVAGAAPPAKGHCRPAATLLDLPVRSEPEWYGLYLGDKKVGWLQTSTAMETRGGRRVWVGRQEMLVEVMVGPRQVHRGVTEERVYEAGSRGRLVSLQSAFTGDGGKRNLRVTCGPTTCKAETATADGTRTVEIPHPGETAEQLDAARLAAVTCKSVSGPSSSR